jgi:hypothetical protein
MNETYDDLNTSVFEGDICGDYDISEPLECWTLEEFEDVCMIKFASRSWDLLSQVAY